MILKKMLAAAFLTSLLVLTINNCDLVCGAPTLVEEENGLNDHRPLSKANKFSFDNAADPNGDVPGEPLNPEDFRNARLLPLEPPIRDMMVNMGSSEINGLFEGDIAGYLPKDETDSRGTKKITLNNAVLDKTLLWPSATVPYVISASFDKKERSVIAKAMLEFHDKTCIRFVPRSGQADYLKLMSGNGCYSEVGRSKGEQQVSLGKGCMSVGIIMHELMHAVGFWHEQSRLDRDDHIIIHWENIIEGKAYNFQKSDRGRIQHLGAPYDTDSIMHYGEKDFSKNNYPTITAKDKDKKLGQRNGFSTTDIFKLNLLYKCNTTIPPPPVESNRTECRDEHKYCKIWKEKGECTKNPWMEVHCRQSCNRCDEEDCGDINDNCARWAKAGECRKYEQYMKIYCKKSCNHCISPRIDCVDNDRYCRVWAASGQC